MERRALILYAFIPVLLFSQTAGIFENLKGKWECKTDEGRIVLEFKTKNLLIYNGEELTYALSDGSVRVEDDILGYVDYPYVLEEDLLTIIYPGGERLQFTKIKSQTSAKDITATRKENTEGSELIQHFAGTWKNYTKYTETRYQYRIHVENDETYWREYYFNGDLYGKVSE